jgi:hypothetical protein
MAVSPREWSTLAAVAIVAFIYESVEVCTAQASSAGSLAIGHTVASASGSFGSFTGSEVGIVPATTVAEELAQEWFTANLYNNETHLAVGVDSELQNLSSSDVICYGVPSLQRRSVDLLPNFACPDIFTAVDASCSCLSTGYNDTDAWEFRVTQRSVESEYPPALTSADVLPINAIRTLQVPPTLKTLYVLT